jgi:hypothetical protein
MTLEEIAAIVVALGLRERELPPAPVPPKMARWRAAGRAYENDVR